MHLLEYNSSTHLINNREVLDIYILKQSWVGYTIITPQQLEQF